MQQVMLTRIVLALKIIRMEAYTKVWKEEFIISKRNVKLLYTGQILFPLQAFPHIACLFTLDLSAEKKKKKQQKTTSELMRTFVHNDFKVFQLALLLDMIYRFTSCCLALVHQEEQGFQTN